MTLKQFTLVIFFGQVGLTHSQGINIRSGYVKPWISYKDNFGSNKWNSSFNLGFGYSIKLNQVLYLQPEVSFVRKGNSFVYQTKNAYIKIYYMDISLISKFSPVKSKQFYLIAGPYLGIGLYGSCWLEAYPNKEPITFMGLPNDSDDTQFLAKIDNRFEGGMQIGAGQKLFENLCFELRYCHGLSNLYDQSNRLGWSSGAYMVKNAKNRMLQLNLVWNLKSKQN